MNTFIVRKYIREMLEFYLKNSKKIMYEELKKPLTLIKDSIKKSI